MITRARATCTLLRTGMRPREGLPQWWPEAPGPRRRWRRGKHPASACWGACEKSQPPQHSRFQKVAALLGAGRRHTCPSPHSAAVQGAGAAAWRRLSNAQQREDQGKWTGVRNMEGVSSEGQRGHAGTQSLAAASQMQPACLHGVRCCPGCVVLTMGFPGSAALNRT